MEINALQFDAHPKIDANGCCYCYGKVVGRGDGKGYGEGDGVGDGHGKGIGRGYGHG